MVPFSRLPHFQMDPIRFELTYQIAAPVEKVWPVLADTERLNREIGLPPTVAQATGQEPVRAARVKVRMAGMPVEWEEDPFEFVENQYFWVRRRLLRGPIRQFNAGVHFRPTPDGTEIQVRSEFLPASPVAAPLIRALARKTRRDWDRLIAGIQAYLAGTQETAYGEGVDLAPPAVRKTTQGKLEASARDLRRDPLASRLFEYLASAGDVELVAIRPFRLASRWGADRYDVLRLCLRAARAGVLDLSWDLLCPNCRGAQNRWSTLDQVRDQSHCDDCQISFSANFDQAIEVTFRPNAEYRHVEGQVFCSGSPRNTPHILAQRVLVPGEAGAFEVELAEGRYRLRNLRADLAGEVYALDSAAAAEARAVYHDDLLGLEPEDGRLRAGTVCLRVENATSERQQVILERLASYEDRATAAVVSVYQEFRDLFSAEILSPGIQLGIQTLPLMFTDLKGSTALYNRLGTASAYAIVRDHFNLLQVLVARHGGGVVKTIGDAVMAGFPTAAAAAACALQIHSELAQFSEKTGHELVLKVGLHQGPCIAVRAYDERLDYFGSTVNLAARTHQESRGGDIVVTEQFLADPDVARLVAPIPQERYTADLRGIGPVPLVRLLVSDE